MRLADLGFDAMLRQRRLDPRYQVPSIGIIVGMLQLTAAAFGKMPARRLLVMRTGSKSAVVEQCVARDAERYMAAAWSDAVAARGDADDQLVHSAAALGIAPARSSAIICGPAISAARPCSHTPAHAASHASSPRARSAAIIPARTSPVPAVASQAGAGGAKPT